MIRQPKLHLMALSTIFFVLVLALVFATLTIGGPRVQAAADGQALFEQKCKSCHTIGGGRTVGPDLKGITSLRDKDWLVRFITAPDRLIAQGDPIAKQLVAEYSLPMPNVGVSNEEAEAILAHIETQSGGSPSATKVTPVATAPPASPGGDTRTNASPGDGKQLFTGETPFKNRGPSCLSCHNASGLGVIGGGTVAKDLTASYATFGETGLVAILKTTPFPLMKEVYRVKSLTDEEIASLVTFLKEANAAKQVESGQNPVIFFLISAAGALVVIGLFQFLWRGRLAGVRRPLVKGGSK